MVGRFLKPRKLELEIRLVHHRNGRASKRFYGSIEELAAATDYLAEQNRQGYNLYWGCALRDGETHQPVRFPCLWCDIDTGEGRPDKHWCAARERIRQIEPSPTHIILSGHGLQPFWALRDLAEIDR